MLHPARLLRRLRSLVWSRRFDNDLNEEMRLHIEMDAEARVRAGMDAASAHETAHRAFGMTAQHRDAARDARGVRAVEDAAQDVRIGVRMLTRHRTYAVVAIVTLALGIGATSALWAAVYRVLLQPFPYPDASRIVALWQTDSRTAERNNSVAPGNFMEWRDRSTSFDLMAAEVPWSFDFLGDAGAEQFEAELVTQDFFTIQGLRPLLGREFRPEEFTPGHERVILLAESAWRSRFGADSSIVGKTITLDRAPYLVAGVMPAAAIASFGGVIWAPKVVTPTEARTRTSGYWNVIARLAPGVTLDRAGSDLQGVAQQVAREYPTTNRTTGAAVIPLREAVVGDARHSLLVLFGAVTFVLLIACVNVANLQAGECIRRQRELAVRTAIGAGRERLVRQLLVESGLVAVFGTIAGLGVAAWAIGVIRRAAPVEVPALHDLALTGATLIFAFVLAGVCAAAIAIPSMLAAARITLSSALATGRRARGSTSVRRSNRVLAVSEVAMAFVLMVGAGLLLRSLGVLLRTNPGFDPHGVAVTTLQSWDYFPTPAGRTEFVRDVTGRLAEIPGVVAAGMGSSLPLADPVGQEDASMEIEGAPVAPGDERPTVRATAATAGYFTALGIPLVNGRAFGGQDIAGTTPVALVSSAFVRRYLPNEDPIGTHVTFGFIGTPVTREVVGVVGDVRRGGLQDDPEPEVYIPHAQAPTGATALVLKVRGEPASYDKAVRAVIASLNRSMPISGVVPMDALLDRSLRQRRFQLGLLSAFSSVALVLAAIGIYGVMSRAATERTHEIGVRLAVGADVRDVRWMVLRGGGMLAVIGIGIGVALAVVLTRYMAGMLFGVRAIDPVTYVGASAVLVLAAVVAAWVPAWRASTVDPVIALRNE